MDSYTCFDCFKKNQCLAKQLTLGNISSFEGYISNDQQYQDGCYIFRQGDCSDKIFIIKSGSIKKVLSLLPMVMSR